MKGFSYNFKLTSLLVLAFSLPIFMIGKPFTDDYSRGLKGYFGWSGDGRPLTDLIMYILNFGGSLTDISPLSSILTILTCTLTCSIVSYYVLKTTELASIIGTCLLVVCPFYFHNMLYHFDSITMSISLLLCALPFLYKGENNWIVFSLGLLLTISSLCTYQASFPLFFVLCMIDLIKNNDRSIKPFIRCLSAGVALIAYQAVIAPHFISGDYVVNHSSPVEVSMAGLFEAYQNLQRLDDYLSQLVTIKWMAVYLPLFILSFIFIVQSALKNKNDIKYVFNLICVLFGIIVSASMFFLTKDPAYYPRVMIGFNAVVMMVACFATMVRVRASWIPLVFVSIALAFNLSIVSNLINYTNSIHAFEKQTAFMMHQDMARISHSSPLYIHGYPPMTQIAKRIDARYPFAKDIIHPDLGWSTTRMFAEIEVPFFKAEKGSYYGKKEEVCGVVVQGWNGIYTITKSNGKYHAVFRNENCL